MSEYVQETSLNGTHLCVIIGESFRSGGRLSRVVGCDTSFEQQKTAIGTHIRFINNIQKKYNINIDVIVQTVYTPFAQQLYTWYSNEIKLTRFIITPVGIGLTNSLHACLGSIDANTLKKYKSVICFRVDLYLREFIDTVFVPDSNKIIYSWYSTSYDSNDVKVNDQFMSFPQKLFNKFQYKFDELRISHHMREYYQHKYLIDETALILTQHTSETKNGWNPLFYIVNRRQSMTWKPTCFYDLKTIEPIPLVGFSVPLLVKFKENYEYFHKNILPLYTYVPCTPELVIRDKCALTLDEDFIKLHTIQNLPVLSSCVRQLRAKDILLDFEIVISKQYGVIQIQNLLPLDFNYSIPHNSGFVGALWNEHHVCFANFIRSFNPCSVLEIGGSHGILSTYFTDLKWYNVDPLGVENKKSKAILIKKFFNKDFCVNFMYDTIVHSHTIEHMYDVNEFVKIQSMKLQYGQRVIFSMPNLKSMFTSMYTNSLTFEHTVIIEEDVLEWVFSKYNFELKAKKYFKEHHSIFYCFEKTLQPLLLEPPRNKLNENTRLIHTFLNKNKKVSNNLNQLLKDKKNIYVFGAHVFTQFLIAFGLIETNIQGVIDNDKDKQGKRLYGTKLYVQSPETLTEKKDAVVVVLTGNYTQEIRQQLFSINNTLTIISYEDIL